MTLKKINNLLLGLIILINLYIVIAPIVPGLLFNLDNPRVKTRQLETIIKRQALKSSSAQPSQPNHVIIPSMLLNTPIYDGPQSQQYKILNKGIWRFSYGSTPDKGGNTILIGHRFTYTNPRGIFYFLNKLLVGDQVSVWWNNKQYLYQVVTVSVVPPTDTAVEHQTKQAELTLFTCTPLWLPKNRLAVVADLETN